jgi:hypothetical protein
MYWNFLKPSLSFLYTVKLVEWVALVLLVRVASGSNLGPKTGYSD